MRDGGAVGKQRGCAAAGEAVGVRSCARSLFIGGVRRWRRGHDGRPADGQAGGH